MFLTSTFYIIISFLKYLIRIDLLLECHFKFNTGLDKQIFSA